MVLSRSVARANKVLLNRFTRLIAGRAPGWAMVVHRGRNSGRVYRTPLFAFPRADGFVIALTYGAQTDWVRNVLTAGGCEIVSRRREYTVDHPRIYRDDRANDMPAAIRFLLRHVIGAPEFLRVDIARENSPAQ